MYKYLRMMMVISISTAFVLSGCGKTQAVEATQEQVAETAETVEVAEATQEQVAETAETAETAEVAQEQVAEETTQEQAVEVDPDWNDPDKTVINIEKNEIIYSDGEVIKFEVVEEEELVRFFWGDKTEEIRHYPELPVQEDGEWRDYLHFARIIMQ